MHNLNTPDERKLVKEAHNKSSLQRPNVKSTADFYSYRLHIDIILQLLPQNPVITKSNVPNLSSRTAASLQ